MDKSTATVIGVAVALAVWVAWALGSDTRHNHGFWTAILLPLAPLLMLIGLLAFTLIRAVSFIVFLALGRRGDHAEFMRRLRVKTGVLMFF